MATHYSPGKAPQHDTDGRWSSSEAQSSASGRAPGRFESDGQAHSSAAATRSVPELLRELRDDAIDLARQEVHLARQEISEKINQAQQDLTAAAVGAALAMAGLVTLVLGLAAALYAGLLVLDVQPLLAGWIAPIAVGLVVLVIGALMATRAKKVTKADHWRPERTERSVRETGRWAENKI